MTKPIHDPSALFHARYAIREAWTSISRLRQCDPTIRHVLDQLDGLCVELTTELEYGDPELPLPAVIVPAEPRTTTVAPGVDRRMG